jgi:hypothetical protein
VAEVELIHLVGDVEGARRIVGDVEGARRNTNDSRHNTGEYPIFFNT